MLGEVGFGFCFIITCYAKKDIIKIHGYFLNLYTFLWKQDKINKLNINKL